MWFVDVLLKWNNNILRLSCLFVYWHTLILIVFNNAVSLQFIGALLAQDANVLAAETKTSNYRLYMDSNSNHYVTYSYNIKYASFFY